MKFLDNIKNSPDTRLDTIAEIVSSKLPVVIYGAGVNAVYTCRFLAKFDITPFCFCDDDTTKTNFLDKPVYTYKQFRSLYPTLEAYIVIAIHQNNTSIYGKLCHNGEQKIIRCLYPDDIFSDTPTDYQFILENENKFAELYSSLADDFSRQTLYNLLNYKITGKCIYLSDIYKPNTYFDPITNLSGNEVFVDCGAFDGDSIIRFVKHVDGQYKEIIGFEPDKSTFAKLMCNVSNFKNVSLYRNGVWNIACDMGFSETGLPCSVASPEAKTSIQMLTIDEMFAIKPITFLKVDVEGAEDKVLLGATNTIRRDKPKLAICVYHKKEDIFAIPSLINSIRSDYKFYLRHHAYISSDETVLYAM